MNAGPMASGWFYLKPAGPAGDKVGPLTWEQLWQAAQTGALVPSDVVWHQNLPGWVPAIQISGLFAGATGAAPAAGPPVSSQQWQGARVAPPQWQAPSAAAPAGAGRHSRAKWLIPVVAIGAVVLLFLVLGLIIGLRGGGGGSVNGLSSRTSLEPPNGEAGTWLVMIYADADDEILEEDMTFDINEAELVGSTDQVKIVAQLDRYAGGYDGDGDVTSARRYLLTQDSDLYTLNSELLKDLGEVDMGDPQTLYDFATWAIAAYPAEHYVLIMSNHGAGWAGGWTDSAPQDGSRLSMQQIDGTVGAIVSDTGIGAFELVGFDACLMAQLEVMSALAPHARYAVASEETEPALGWSYAGFLQALTGNPSMTGRDLGQAIVDSYIEQDVRVTDEGARRLLTGGDYSAQAVVKELDRTSTMSSLDLATVQDLDAALNDLAVALTNVDQGLVAQARAYSQSYTSPFGEDSTPSFIDLGSFVDLVLAEVGDAGVTTAAQGVKDALARTVVAETHGEERPGSSGLSIYFPNSEEYTATFGGSTVHYPSSVGRFASASLWDDFLTFHYTGAPFEASAADLSAVTPALANLTDFTRAVAESAPATGADVVGPGAGGVTIAPITVDVTEVAPDGEVNLSTEIAGANIAYVYYYIAYYWESDGSYLSADAGYVEPGNVKESGGVYYPDWGEGEAVPVNQPWKPTLYYMSDGNEENDMFAFFQPTTYGAEVAGDIYSVDGTYTFVDTGTKMDAQIDFNGGGDMVSVWGYDPGANDSGIGTWHELTPRSGDTFTITSEYIEFDKNPDGEFVDYDGGIMTFGDTPFTMVAHVAPAGDYKIGMGVEDLDGNVTWEYADVTVTE
jgi:hypothetical protein